MHLHFRHTPSFFCLRVSPSKRRRLARILLRPMLVIPFASGESTLRIIVLAALYFISKKRKVFVSSMAPAAKWDGNSMTQADFMEKDTVLVLDTDDNVIGSASKKDSHVFRHGQPRGIVHRAFSVFLFDESTGELLLQQRASTKITFPNVWTNTCCSHPLHGMVPPEVDGPGDLTDGSVMGVKYAAIRKLYHELGIPANELPVEKFKFLTRLHYWAADTVTHGRDRYVFAKSTVQSICQ